MERKLLLLLPYLWVGTGDKETLFGSSFDRILCWDRGTGRKLSMDVSGYLVTRLSAVTHLTQCRSELTVSMSSPSRDALNLSQADRDGSIYAYD